jgi:hypothetical protein
MLQQAEHKLEQTQITAFGAMDDGQLASTSFRMYPVVNKNVLFRILESVAI